MKDLYRLVYTSKASEDMSYSELDYILTSSRFHNAQNDITGVLIYRDGFFLQLLEGPFAKVRQTMSKIITDKRHLNMHVLHEAYCEERLFADWTMRFVDFDLSTLNSQSLNLIFNNSMLFEIPKTAEIESMFCELTKTS